jgi:hypothetical protein
MAKRTRGRGTIVAALHAAKSAQNRTVGELASAVGLTRRRVFGIFEGEYEPAKREVDVLAAELGLSATDLTAIQGPGGMAAFLTLLPSPQTPTRLVPPDEPPLFIDKIQFTADVTDRTTVLRSILPRLARPTRRQPRRRSGGSVYRESVHAGRSVFVAHTPRSMNTRSRFLLMKFHPGSPDAVAVFRSLRPYLVLGTSLVTHLDIAIDLPIELRDLQPMPDRKRKYQAVIGPGGVETLYFGRRGDGQSKAYDKRLQLNDKRKQGRWLDWNYAAPPRTALTRIEATVGGFPLPAFPRISNPFSTSWSPLPLFAEGLPFFQSFVVSYARAYGWPHLRARIGKDKFQKLIAVLKSNPLASMLPSPASVFDMKWRDVAGDLARRLGV